MGCATGGRSRELIRRTGCRVQGVELLPQLVEWGTAETAAAGLADALTFQQGSVLDLPLPDGEADLERVLPTRLVNRTGLRLRHRVRANSTREGPAGRGTAHSTPSWVLR